jgi:hypothetical protein
MCTDFKVSRGEEGQLLVKKADVTVPYWAHFTTPAT